jgi:hypothetical protein
MAGAISDRDLRSGRVTPKTSWLDEHDAELHLSALSLGEMLLDIHLVTRDTGDFPEDVPVLNPWKV